MFDRFSILSGNLFYSKVMTELDGWLIETQDTVEYTQGTSVRMMIGTDATRSIKEAFEKYTDEDFDFSKRMFRFRSDDIPENNWFHAHKQSEFWPALIILPRCFWISVVYKKLAKLSQTRFSAFLLIPIPQSN